MQLVAQCNQTIRIETLSSDFKMRKGEEIRTEISRKFTIETMQELLEEAKFQIIKTFSSTDDYFSLGLARLA